MSYELNSRIVDNSETVLPTDDSKLIVEVHENWVFGNFGFGEANLPIPQPLPQKARRAFPQRCANDHDNVGTPSDNL
jgi:hypothetical protein